MIENVFVTIALRNDYIARMLETLYKYTDHDFRVVLIDMTRDGLGDLPGVHLKLRPHRNLGFAKGMNEGIVHALHWGSPYITCINDDVEFINKRWWDGIIETFERPSEKEVLAVNPESIRIPMWGYGMQDGEYVEVLDYKEKFTQDDYDFLLKGDFAYLEKKYDWLPDAFPRSYTGVCDGIAAWGPVCKRKLFTEIGLWDERFYPGGAEDYDMMGRIYSKGYRALSTRSSWVWHWWGKSRDEEHKVRISGLPIESSYRWSRLGELWPKELNEGHELDVWGYYTNEQGERVPLKRIPDIGVVDI